MDDEDSQDEQIKRSATMGKAITSSIFIDDDSGEDSESFEESGSESEDGNGEDNELECEEEEVEDYLDEELEKVVGGDGPAASNIAEAGSDEEGENCPICLNLFKGQLVGTPENCAHFFCIDCIVEWSKNANSCPVDRIVFNHICVRSHYGGTVVKKIPVENKCVLTDGDDDTTNCEVCGSGDREDRLLLCDGCDAGYHMECLNPPLNSVPVEEWFCPECAANSTESDHENVTEDEVTAILAEEFPSTSRQQRSLRTRAIARTQQSERVRATVNRNRIIHARRSQNEPFQLMESSLFDETIEAVVAGLSTVVYERPLHPRARTLRRRRKRRTGKRKKKGRKTVTGVKTKGWRTTKRRRRFKRKKRTLEKTSVTARTRIARSLGITKPIHGATIPSVYRSAEPSWGFLRADIGAPSLSIYGDPFALETSESEEEQPQPLRSPSPLSMKRRLLSHSALRSHQPVARPISVGVARSAVAAESPQENEAAAVPDLLGSILSGQNFLMMNSNNVVISRDGSLKPKSQVTSSFHQSTSRDAKEGEMVKEVLQPGSMCSGASTSISNTEHSRPFCLNGHAKPSQSNTSCSSSLLSLPSTSETSPQSSLPSNSSTVSGNLCFKPQNANIPRPGLSKNLVNMRSQFSELVGCTKRTDSFRPSEHKSKHSGLSSKDRSVPSSNVPWKTPPKRLDIADFPRIPKLKNKGNGTDSGPGSSRNTDIPDSCISKLTGNRDGNPAATVGNSKTSDQQRGSSSGNSDSTSTSTYTSSVPGSSQGGRGAGFSIQSFKIKRPGILEQLGRPYYLPVYDPFKNKEKAQQKTKSKPLLTKKASTSGEIYDPFNPTGSDSSSPSNSPQRTEPATPVAETSKLPSSETKKTDSTVKDKLFATKQVKTSSTSASYGVSVKMRSIVSELYDNMGDDDVDGSDAEQEKVKQDTRASSTTDVGRIKPIVESFSAANGRGLSLNSRSVVEEGINIRNENETTFQLDEDFIRKVKNKISQKAIRSRSRSGSVSSSGKKHKKQKKSSVLKDSKMPRSRSKSPLPVYGEKSKIKRERSCSSGRSRSSSNEKHKKKKPKSKGKHKEKQSKRSRSKERKRSRSRSVSAGGFTSENSESKKKKKKRSRSREQSPSSSVERKKKKSKRGRSRERYNKFQFRSKEKKRSRSRTRSRERKKRQSRSTSRSRGRRSRSRERKQKSRSKSKDRKGSRFQDKSHYYEKKREVVYRSRSRSRDKKVFVAREKSPSPERKRKENYSVNQSWPREKIAAVKEKSLSPGRRESSLSSRSKSRDRKGLGMWEKSPSPEGKQIEYSFKIRSKSKERKEVTKEKSQSPERKAREVLLRSRAPARERREFGSREKSQSPEIKREDAYFKNRSESRERSDFASVERSQSPDLKNEDSPLKNKSWYRDIKVTVTRERSKSPENKDGEFPVRNVSWSRESKESRGKDKVQSTETECEETSVRRISLFRVGRESGTRGRSQSPEEGPLKSGPKSAEVKEHRTREKSRCFEESEIQETSHSPEVKTEDIPVRSVMWYKDSKDYAIKGVQSPEIKSEEISLRSQSGSREDKFKVRGSSLSPEVKREESQSRSGSKSRSRKKSKHREKSRTPERDKETCFSSITRCIEGSESFIAERSESPETKHDDIPLIGESDSKYENETIEDTQVCDETLLKSKLWFEDETESETLGSTYTSEVKSEDLSGSILWRGETEPETTDQSISADIKREESSFGSALESGEGQKSETDEIPHSPVLKDHQNKLESSCASADENKSQTREVQFSEQTNEERSRDDFEWLELDVVEPLPSPEKSNVLQKDATIVTAPVDEEGRNVLTEVSHLDVLSETTANDSVSTEEMYSMEYVNTDAHMSPEHANEASLIMPESIGSNICENVGFISSDAPAADITFCNRSSAVVASAEVSQESLGNYGSSLEFPQDSVVPQVISLPDSIYSPTDEEEEEEDITPDSSHVSILQGEERAVEEHAEGPSVTEEELEGDYGDDDDAAKAESEYGTQIPGIKSKALVKRVTWNLQDEDQEEEDSEKTTRLSFHKSQRVKEGAWKNMEPSQILNQVLFNEPAPTNYMIPQPMFPDLDSSQVYSQTVPLAPLLSASLPSCVPVSQPTAEYIMQGSLPLVGTIAGQAFTSEPVFQAVPSEPAAQSITTGSFEAKVTEVHLEEKSKNAEYMKKLQIQERAVEEVKLAIKPFYQNREITKDEYKDILRKAVQKICRSRSGEINPVKVANLVKAYVEKYKHMRKYKKTDTSEGSHDWRMYSENPEYSQTA